MNAPRLRLAGAPALQCFVRLAGGEIPESAPGRRKDDHQHERQEYGPAPPAWSGVVVSHRGVLGRVLSKPPIAAFRRCADPRAGLTMASTDYTATPWTRL